jgi:GNAT superfamily N-acetyltransferase
VTPASTCEDPPSQLARAVEARAPSIVSTTHDTQNAEVRATLRAWLEAIPVLERRALSRATRARLEDSRRLCGELERVLAGVEAGEGCASERALLVALARGRIHGVSSMFACPRGTFIELLVTAPWNILGADDPPDPRTVRGAGTALVSAAVDWSRRLGCAGRVALQAENRSALAFYDRLGFLPMKPEDHPLLLVPRGPDGWSTSVLRVARGKPGAEEERSPWLVLDRARSSARGSPAPGARDWPALKSAGAGSG